MPSFCSLHPVFFLFFLVHSQIGQIQQFAEVGAVRGKSGISEAQTSENQVILFIGEPQLLQRFTKGLGLHIIDKENEFVAMKAVKAVPVTQNFFDSSYKLQQVQISGFMPVSVFTVLKSSNPQR